MDDDDLFEQKPLIMSKVIKNLVDGSFDPRTFIAVGMPIERAGSLMRSLLTALCPAKSKPFIPHPFEHALHQGGDSCSSP
jgi:hypothetical protein